MIPRRRAKKVVPISTIASFCSTSTQISTVPQEIGTPPPPIRSTSRLRAPSSSASSSTGSRSFPASFSAVPSEASTEDLVDSIWADTIDDVGYSSNTAPYTLQSICSAYGALDLGFRKTRMFRHVCPASPRLAAAAAATTEETDVLIGTPVSSEELMRCLDNVAACKPLLFLFYCALPRGAALGKDKCDEAIACASASGYDLRRHCCDATRYGVARHTRQTVLLGVRRDQAHILARLNLSSCSFCSTAVARDGESQALFQPQHRTDVGVPSISDVIVRLGAFRHDTVRFSDCAQSHMSSSSARSLDDAALFTDSNLRLVDLDRPLSAHVDALHAVVDQRALEDPSFFWADSVCGQMDQMDSGSSSSSTLRRLSETEIFQICGVADELAACYHVDSPLLLQQPALAVSLALARFVVQCLQQY